MAGRVYEDFRIEISRPTAQEIEVRVVSAAGETTTPSRQALAPSTIRQCLESVEQLQTKRLHQDELLVLGQDLGRLLLPPDVRHLFLRVLEACRDDRGVRLRIVCHDAELSALPWEYTYIRRSAEHSRLAPFLALDKRVSIVRHDPQESPLPSLRPLRGGHLRVVCGGARALPGFSSLVGDDDFGAIRNAFAASVRDVNVDLLELPEPLSNQILTEALRDAADVFQFIGHGTGPDEDPGLVVSDGSNGVALISPSELAGLLRQADVRVAVLSSCFSGYRGSGEWNGVAAALVRAGVPAVIAMQQSIEGSHALVFEQGLYSGLAAGLSLDEAVALGRRKITELGALAEWGIPVLYTRSDGILFTRPLSSTLADQLRQEMLREPLDLSIGLAFEASGDWGKAVDAYLLLLGTAPRQHEEAQLCLRLGACLWKDGESDEAEEYLARARRLASEMGDENLLGAVLLEMGRRDEEEDRLGEAARRYEEAFQLLDQSPQARKRIEIRLASIDRRRGNLRTALSRLENPSLVDTTLTDELQAEYLDVLGAVYLARGQFSQAITTLEEALSLDERVFTEHVASATRLLLADAHLGRGDRDASMRQVEMALEVYEDSRDESGLSEAWVMKGQIFEDAGDYQAALRAYSRASQYDAAGRDIGGEARANRLLGRTALKRGDADAAEDFFSRAHDLLLRSQDDIEKAALLTEEAYLDLEEGEFREAITKLETVLQIAEADEDERAVAVAKRHLAIALRERGLLARSASLLEEAMELLEERGDLKELEVLLDDLGEVRIELGEYEEAIAALDRSLRLDDELDTGRGRGRSLILLGRANLNLGRRTTAGTFFKDALEVFRALGDSVGESDARYELGRWFSEEGEAKTAIDHLTQALRIDRVQEDRLGVVRCHRALARLYRRTGNWPRAHEHLEDAEAELGTIPVPVERSLIRAEAAELALARGDAREAVQLAQTAKSELVGAGSVVEAAVCDRIVAKALARLGDPERAVVLLEEAQSVFEQHSAVLELDITFDDLAEVFLMMGDLGRARSSIERSLKLDDESGWGASRGRSFLLLGDVEDEAGHHDAAYSRYGQAREAFDDAGDEVGQAEVCLRLGAWQVQHGTNDAALDQAIRDFKMARRIFQAHHDLRGMSRAYRRLGQVYFERDEFERAREAFEQAEDCLESLRSDREMAPLALAKGRLFAAQGKHNEAINSFEIGLGLYRDMRREPKVHEVLRRMSTAYQNLGDLDAALDCLRQIGIEQARIWNVLIDNLHPDVSSASSGSYRAGSYDIAVRRAIDALRLWRSRIPAQSDLAELSEFADAFIKASEVPEAQMVWQNSSIDAVAAIGAVHLIFTLAALRDQVGEERNS